MLLVLLIAIVILLHVVFVMSLKVVSGNEKELVCR